MAKEAPWCKAEVEAVAATAATVAPRVAKAARVAAVAAGWAAAARVAAVAAGWAAAAAATVAQLLRQ